MKLSGLNLKIFGILAICWLGPNIYGQNFKSDISALRKKYSVNLSMNISTQIISNDPNYPSTTISGSIKTQGNEMLYKQGNEEILYSKKYMLIVNSDDKNIIVDTATENYNAAPLSMLHLDSLVTAYTSVKFTNVGGKKQYDIVPKNGEVKKFTIVIGANGLLETVKISLTDEEGGGTAILTYSGYTANPAYPADQFSPWRYVKRVNGKFIASETYKNYTVDSAL